MHKFAASFNPEHWELAQLDEDEKLDLFEYLIKYLNIKDLRLAIRWGEILKGSELDLSPYLPYISRLLKEPDPKLTLNIGPIKTMRWPEETIPDEVAQLHTKLGKEKIVYPDSDLARTSLEYLRSILELLESRAVLGKVTTFQLDNEPFNRFGQYGLKMSKQWLLETVRVLSGFVDEPEILFNSAGKADLSEIISTIDLAEQQGLNCSWKIGVNYYYRVPGVRNIPWFADFLDDLSYPWLGVISPEELVDICRKRGWKLEVTEFQGEPWETATAPGNDFSLFKSKLNKVEKLLSNIPDSQNLSSKLTVRYWGIEHLLIAKKEGRLTDDQAKILGFIRGCP